MVFRRLWELQVARADPSVDALAASALLREWFLASGKEADWDSDKDVLAWMDEKVGIHA